MGGYSPEQVISIKSAENVFKCINKDLFDPYKVYLFKDKWVVEKDNKQYPINRDDFSVRIKENKIKFDAIFNIIHGTPGENGYIQAYFELLGIPYTGSGVCASAITFNKRSCLTLVHSLGIPIANHFYLKKDEPIIVDAIIEKVGLPCFVKPNQSGSSLGASKVTKKEDLLFAIKKAFREDSAVIIEAFLRGREFSLGVIPFQGGIKVLPITEIISQNDFFDYKAKYEGEAQEITPADIPLELREDLEETMKKIYIFLDLRGFIRAEFILVGEKKYFLEVNANPGLSKESIIPQQMLKEGISLEKACNELLISLFA